MRTGGLTNTNVATYRPYNLRLPTTSSARKPGTAVMMSQTDYALEARNLSKRFAAVSALSNVSLQVPKGSTFLLLGENGAGKSTLLRILLDIIRADQGSAFINGYDVVKEGASARALIGWVPESHDIPPSWLTVSELLRTQQAYYTCWNPDYAASLIHALEINPQRKYGELSKGLKRRVQILLALAHAPPLLLLDEPTDGLDPLVRDVVNSVLSDHKRTYPTTILISTHLVHEVEESATHVAILKAGEVVRQAVRSDIERSIKHYQLRVDPTRLNMTKHGLRWRCINRTSECSEMSIEGDSALVEAAVAEAGGSVQSVRPVSLEEAVKYLLASTA